MEAGPFVLWAVIAALSLGILLPISKIPHGIIRGLAFPREQYFVIAVGFAAVAPVLQPGATGLVGAGILCFVAIVNLFYIIKFTPLWRRQSVRAEKDLADDTTRHISLVAANVKLSNRDYERLIRATRHHRPDLVMAIEVDGDWIAALKESLANAYHFWIEVPQDNGYGLCVMSRFEVAGTEVRNLITKDIPSIRTRVTLPSGQHMRLYVLHPEPPVIDHDTGGRDSEIALAGLEAAKDPLPAVVAGDLNDVAWSTTTRRFQRLSGLLDPRVGRGFYNTFSATMPWMRWPLDHLFHDAEFRLVHMERLEKIGSDHFPMLFRLALAGNSDAGIGPGDADKQEKRDVKETIRTEQKRTREPIGADWEDG